MAAITSSAMAKTIATSDMCCFLVGPTKQEFFVHCALVQHESPVLDKMMTGGFTESVTLTVKWDDIEVPTFVSFWQYLYSGTYQSPSLDQVTPEDCPANPEHVSTSLKEDPKESVVPTAQISPRDVKLKRKMERKATQAQDVFSWGRPASVPPSRALVWNEFMKLGERKFHQPGNADGADGDGCGKMDEITTERPHARLLIHHVRVFILADRYDMPRLMTIAHGRLYADLVKLDMGSTASCGWGTAEPDYSSIADHIVVLLRLCSKEPVPERLRELVVVYAATQTKELWKRQGFTDLLKESKALAMEIMSYMVMMIN